MTTWERSGRRNLLAMLLRPAPSTAPTVDAAVLRATALASPQVQSLVVPVLIVVAAASWLGGALSVDYAAMTDLGLVSVLPPAALLGPVLLLLAFVLTLGALHRTALLIVETVLLVVMLFGMPALTEPEVSLRVVYRHAGVAQYIQDTGTIDPTVDAYFSWPGFFALLAVLEDVTGLDPVTVMGPWAPVAFQLLNLAPLFILLRSAAPRTTVAWVGIWIFYLTNWIAQDYLAPQALGYFLYLVVIATMVVWFPRAEQDEDEPLTRTLLDGTATRPVIVGSPQQRMILIVLILLMFGAVVPTHQLTPFVFLTGLLAVRVSRRSYATGLITAMATLLLVWFAFMATSYLEGHFVGLVSQVGQVGDVVEANVTNRIGGAPEHEFIVQWRLVSSGILWTLAGLGWVLEVLRGRRHLTSVALAVAPVPLLGMQLYGGEMILRMYLFSLPFVSLFAACAVLGRSPVLRPVRATVVMLVLTAMFASFTLTRYGNERVDYFTPEDRAAVEALYDVASPGMLLLAGSGNLPWKDQDYATYEYRTLDGSDELQEGVGLLTVARRELAAHPEGGYLILTESQERYADSLGLFPRGELDRLARAMPVARDFSLAWERGDASIYRYNGPTDTDQGDGS